MQADDLPDGWDIAGWEHGADWIDVQNGGPLPNDNDLIYSDQVVLSFTDDEGETSYYTVHGGFDEDFSIEDAIADLSEVYGVG